MALEAWSGGFARFGSVDCDRRMCSMFVVLLLLFQAVELHALSSGRVQFAQSSYNTTEDFGVAYITVQRHLGSDGRAAVYVSTSKSAGSAVVGRDFQPIFNRSMVWQDGDDLEKELYVKVLNDGQPQELAKNFTLYLHDPVSVKLNDALAQTTITLVPPSNLYPGSFRFLNSTMTVTESALDLVRIPVLWRNGTTASASVAFTITCGSACSPGDYVLQSPVPQILNWTRPSGSAAGAPLTQYITLSIPDDGLYEQPETFTIRLALVDRKVDDTIGVGKIGSIGEMVITIAGPNNVRSGSVQFEADCFPDCPSKKYEVQDGGVARVVVRRQRGSDGPASVTFSTRDGTATAGVDYVAVSKVLEWAEGDSSDKEIVVESIQGVLRQESKRFYLVLSGNISVSLSPEHASTSYVDLAAPANTQVGVVNFIASSDVNSDLDGPDELFAPLVARASSGFSLCPQVVVHKPGSIAFTLRRDFGNVLEPASVTVRAVEGTTKAGVDYLPLSTNGSVVISWSSQDSSIKSVELTILDPNRYYTTPRSLWLEMSDLDNVGLGDCNRVEIVLNAITSAPRVTAFSLDMNRGELRLTLSVPVLAQSLDSTKLRLQSDSEFHQESTAMLTFTSQTTTMSPDGTDIMLDIGVADLNALKAVSGLAKSIATTFLSSQPGLFLYMVNDCVGVSRSACSPAQPLGEISQASALQAQTFTSDTTSPVLIGFTLDLPRQLVKLHFSEPVNVSTVRVNAISFSNTALAAVRYPLSVASTRVFAPNPDPLSGALLSDANRLPPDGTFVTLLLGETEITGIKGLGNGQIGVARSSTFLALTSSFVTDFAVPSNPVAPVGAAQSNWMQAAAANCTPCAAGTYLVSSCSDLRDRVCATCSICPANTYALTACTPTHDTICYPCTECPGSQYAAVQCSPTTNRVCLPCTKCTTDEYTASPCYAGANRVCRSCNSCTLTKDQERACANSMQWKRLQMKAPYSCPTPDMRFQTLEARLQREKSNRCGAGRCSCVGGGVGNANNNGDNFPDDPRCTGPELYNIFL